jgi:response regulator RpfG family c-di-GMP phosphodiesterase
MKDLIMVCVAMDTESLESLSRVTRTMPCRVLMTTQPEEALRWVDANHVSLVLTDQWLKDMSGSRLLKEVSRRCPTTARFLLAATPQSRDEISGDDTTVHGVIGKPWDGAALKRTILAILRWQEERSVAPYPQEGQVERRKSPRKHHGRDDAARPSLA